MKSLIFILAFTVIGLVSCKTTQLPKEEKATYLYKNHHSTNLDLPYRLMYPNKVQKKYPLFIFLHGAGERGDDNEKQLVHGSEWVEKNLNNYPAIAVFPQCPSNDYWSSVSITTNAEGQRKFSFTDDKNPTPAMSALISLIEDISAKPYVDQSRIYIMGLSMGGMATFELLWRMPGKFAAAAPICGGGAESKAKEMALTSGIWIFHGAKDSVVPVDDSRKMNLAISKFKNDVKYTEYKDVDHNSWDNVFKETDFFKWMFNQKN